MPYIYAVANQKGGVGKTTTSVNLAVYLAAEGQRVLLVDLDPQANASSSLGVARDKAVASTYEVLLGQATAAKATLRNGKLRLALIPAAPSLAAAEVELVGEVAREYRLKEALESEMHRYDYVLIDCPPSLGLLTVNALTAASSGVLIPVQSEYLALEGLGQLSRTVQLVKQRLNRDMEIAGLVLTMHDTRTALAQQVAGEVEKHFGDKVFRTRIPRSVRLSEAPSYGQPILTYSPASPGAAAYRALAVELLERNHVHGRSATSTTESGRDTGESAEPGESEPVMPDTEGWS
jgi:chromosome partitioning protein